MISALPHIRHMSPYALSDTTAPDGVLRTVLSQNESLRAPSPEALQAAANCLSQTHLYPDPDWTDLRIALAALHDLDEGSILCGGGSLDLIGCIARVFAGPERAVLAPAHAYPFFRTASQMANARFDTAPETALTVSVDALVAAQHADTGVVFVANPGNPTGTRVSKAEIVRLRQGLRPDVLLVIDEAYGEFSDEAQEQCFDMVDKGNTVVLRTFSKAYGMAGFRVGWGVFPQTVRDQIRKVMNPNNVSVMAQVAARAAVQDQGYMRETCALTADARNWVTETLKTSGFTLSPSDTNFVLIDLERAEGGQSACTALGAQGIFLRGQAGAGSPGMLRMTVGNREANERAVLALEQWRQEYVA